MIEDYAKIGLPTSAKAVLLIEQDGPFETVERDMEKIEAICKKATPYPFRPHKQRRKRLP